ncbi:long tail fiber protein distal subunit [Micromonas pusilla virus SP1]|uniref:Peptidase S74 domain-containing protein n=1 Tax=Micromonas pusilla virus SP1 TaxID=373996 RepID=G9E5X4_MPSP1|nr:long tail fiber protein distal subunit [Micromonas pusilla virus SP1]AET84801.1 hypothetical protein MPXG_00003 [Micromonas pusilla virus SP1]
MSIQGNDGFLDLENASLRVTGNVHAEGLKVGSVRLQPAYSLQSVTNISNTTTQMVQFTNPTKGFDVTSNIEVGDANLYVDTTTGRVGVGTNLPLAALDVRGDIYATGNITAYSDKRAKSDIQKIENALDKIDQLNGYTFTMNDKRYTGVIAQEVLPVLPEAVTGSEETNYAVAYGNMMGLIIEAIKELKEKIG